jgi:hypothetical protein
VCTAARPHRAQPARVHARARERVSEHVSRNCRCVRACACVRAREVRGARCAGWISAARSAGGCLCELAPRLHRAVQLRDVLADPLPPPAAALLVALRRIWPQPALGRAAATGRGTARYRRSGEPGGADPADRHPLVRACAPRAVLARAQRHALERLRSALIW